MAKASAASSVGDLVHTRTTSDAVETTAAVLAVDGNDEVVATPALGASGERALSMVGGVYAATAGTITTATSTVTTGNISRAGNITVGIIGTYAGVSIIFEASPDGGPTNWYPVGLSREDTGGNEGGSAFALPSNTTRIWTTGSPGFTHFRVRATAFTSGTATVIIAPGGMPFEPLVSAVLNPLVATPTRANVATSAASTTLRAANAARKGLIIANAATSPLYVDLTGGTATTTTANSFPLPVGATWTMDPTTFTQGAITGIWAATGGNGANVTEFT